MLKNEICADEPTILWNRLKGNDKLDWLAEEILCTIQDLGFDAAHLESKRCDLTVRIDMKFSGGVAFWMINA
jgi:hypothetical protein